MPHRLLIVNSDGASEALMLHDHLKNLQTPLLVCGCYVKAFWAGIYLDDVIQSPNEPHGTILSTFLAILLAVFAIHGAECQPI